MSQGVIYELRDLHGSKYSNRVFEILKLAFSSLLVQGSNHFHEKDENRTKQRANLRYFLPTSVLETGIGSALKSIAAKRLVLVKRCQC
jgi:hypothetical protein